jgi:outer membrane protein assembly factor BamD
VPSWISGRAFFIYFNVAALAELILYSTFEGNTLTSPTFMTNRFLLLFSAFVLLFTMGACNRKFNKIVKSTDHAYKLKMADEYFEKKEYRLAQQLYEELYPIYKGTEKFEELYYKDAYCFYYMKNYRDAENFFKGFLEVFPNSSKAEEVDFMHALCFFNQSPKLELEQTNTAKSIGVLQTFINMHPGSPRVQEATAIIDKCRNKLEEKELRGAELYFKIGQYRAAAISYNNLLNSYPESVHADKYKLQVIKSYYKFAKLSVAEKQIERYEQVITEFQDFSDRFPESSLKEDAKAFHDLSVNNIKEIQNEQIKTSAQL